MEAYRYFDHNATTPVREEVVQVMAATMVEAYGNPNSIHRAGVAARYAIEKARRLVARAINARRPEHLTFTGGGSEANNLALRGVCLAAKRRGRGNHLIVSGVEHKAVLDPAKDLDGLYGIDLTILPVDRHGRVEPSELQAALRPSTILVSIMMANNEVGSINPIRELAALTHKKSSALFHTDAIQCLGRIPIDVQTLGVDLLSLSAHKCGGPKGVGALHHRDGIELEGQITGGGQEFGLRSGTENVAGIVGFGEAAQLAVQSRDTTSTRLYQIRELLWGAIAAQVPGVVRNSPIEECLPNTLHLSIPGCESRRLVMELDRLGFACSSGSACTSSGTELSHVLVAMGFDDDRAGGALRLSLGPEVQEADALAFAPALKAAITACGSA